MKTYGGVDIFVHVFFTSALVGQKWLASRPLNREVVWLQSQSERCGPLPGPLNPTPWSSSPYPFAVPTARASLPRPCFTFSKIRTQFHAVSLSDPSRNCIRPNTPLEMKGRKISERPLSCVTFCTLTSKICYHLPLHRATITAAQMTSPVPEIMDTYHM
jgi:hypothetical protein